MKEQIFRKLTSRKFWVAIATIIAGIVLIFGYGKTDAETISGAVMTFGSAIIYMLTEGRIDAKNVGTMLESAETIIEEIKDGKDDTDEIRD